MAELKAVILTICPEARIVDVTHEIEKFDIEAGSFLLAQVAPYFPKGTVHLAIVDPGVGGARRPVVVVGKRSIYVGPDNGLLIPAAETEGIRHVYELQNPSMMRREISATFHGRDIFAPAAAHLARGSPPRKCGPEIYDYVKQAIPEGEVRGDAAICRVVHVDGFGNLIINLRRAHMGKLNLKPWMGVTISTNGKRIRARVVTTYADLVEGELGLLLGSQGFLEVVCREGSAAQRLRLKKGARVEINPS